MSHYAPDINHDVRRFLASLAEPGAVPATLADDTDVFATGVVKSMNVLELINHLEDTYGFTIGQRDVFAGHLRSVGAITAFVVARTTRKVA
jgi:acyl carrier protein